MTSAPERASTVIAERYEVQCLLGTGGMGSVYRANDLELGVQVALKMLRRELLDDDSAVARFRREVALARRVTNRHVARIFDIGSHGDDRFLTMELIEGCSLRALVRSGQQPIADVVRIACDLCEGLAAAHEAGVVHRDLKPDNVLLAADGRAVITDFGIARAIDSPRTTSSILGTPYYISPEQIEGVDDLDGRADIYALGVMMFELCCGQPPFSGGGSMNVVMARMTQDPPDPRTLRPGMPEPLADVILGCLARDRDARFADATELRDALGSIDAAQTEPMAPAPTQPVSSATAENTRELKTIAVLPLRNRGDAEDEYLACAITEDLIDHLSMTGGLRVRPRGAVTRLRDSKMEAREAGRQLQVDVVVDGSIQRLEDSLRVTTRVIGVADGFQLWANRFECPISDVLTVADETAAAIATSLAVELTTSKVPRPSNPIALDLYLRAKRLRRVFQADDTDHAIQLLEQALEIEPDSVALLAAHSLACARGMFLGAQHLEAGARRSANRALAVRPDSAEAHAALCSVAFQTGDVAQAIAHARAGLSLRSFVPEIHELYARIVSEIGDLDVAASHLERVIQAEPDELSPRVERLKIAALRGEHEEVARHMPFIERETARAARMFCLRIAVWNRDYARIDELLGEPFAEMSDERFEQVMRQRGGRLFAEAESQSWRRKTFNLQVRTERRCLHRELDKALESVRGAVDAGLIDKNWMQFCPILEELRQRPEFAALAATVQERADELARDL